jgi:hypothetical protein
MAEYLNFEIPTVCERIIFSQIFPNILRRLHWQFCHEKVTTKIRGKVKFAVANASFK